MAYVVEYLGTKGFTEVYGGIASYEEAVQHAQDVSVGSLGDTLTAEEWEALGFDVPPDVEMVRVSKGGKPLTYFFAGEEQKLHTLAEAGAAILAIWGHLKDIQDTVIQETVRQIEAMAAARLLAEVTVQVDGVEISGEVVDLREMTADIERQLANLTLDPELARLFPTGSSIHIELDMSGAAEAAGQVSAGDAVEPNDDQLVGSVGDFPATEEKANKRKK